MPGMMTTYGQRIARVDDDGYTVAYTGGGHLQTVEADALPNLTDPATLGCLLALVREACMDSRMCLYPVKMLGNHLWNVGVPWETGGLFVSTAPAEAEALVAALEAAP
jgi:hypothetical protein